MNIFKRKIKRYAEITWEYPVPMGVPLLYYINTTNSPQDCDRSMGNGGRGYQVYDLHDEKQRQSFMDLSNQDRDCSKIGYRFDKENAISNALKDAGFDKNLDGSLNPERFFEYKNNKLDQKK